MEMTQVGGPAAINGFLYQILHHVGWLAEVSLSGTVSGVEVGDAYLVLEPRSGGDARAEGMGVYLVEQYKTRKDGTWAIADIISVLRDLRKAIPPSHPVNARYRFITDGRAGLLDAWNIFLADVKSVATPDSLDQSERRIFGKDATFTNREFFHHVMSASRTAGQLPSENEQMAIFHLLKHFEMEFGASGMAQAAKTEKLLRRYAPDLGDECGIRQRLVGVLMDKLSLGEARFDATKIDAMLRDVGLNTSRLRSLALLSETLGMRTRSRLTRLGYKPERDVRSPPDWPENKPVLLIAGASGSGKTWQLGRLLELLEQSREIATLVLGSNTRESALADAARDIWQIGLNETSEKSFIAVSHFLHELAPDGKARQITIAVDDVHDIDLARSLIRQDWTEWGMRLVLTVPLAVARSVEVVDRDSVHVHHIDNFSINELDQLLQQSGRKWTELPSDLKKLLRNPILAGIFLDLPYPSVQRVPRSEYEIFEALWARIAAKGRLGDEGILIALATSFMDGKTYPQPRQKWLDIGLSDDSLVRLDAAGWLRVDEDGAAIFAHDRLLNWAVAKSLVGQYQRKELTPEKFADFVSNKNAENGGLTSRRLGYVAMDTFWLLTKDERNTELLGSIVARMESSHEFGSYGEELYVNLLPTLGQQAVPLLLERLNTIIAGGNGDYRITVIGKALANLARQDHVELSEVVRSLLSTTSRDRHNIAMTILAAAPDAAYLDLLWDIHQRRVSALENNAERTRHSDYQESFTALRAGVAQNSDWLRNRILLANPEHEHVSELGHLLNGLEHSLALAIWQDAGDVLMAKNPVNKPRSLLHCIARFGDREKLDFVVKHLSRPDDFGSGSALYALSVLDPRAAIERLVEVSQAELSLTRDNWLPALLRAEPELTHKHLLALAESEPKGRRIIEMLFGERPDEMNEVMLRFVLRRLQNDLGKYLGTNTVGDAGWLFHPLKFLGSIARPDFLAILEAEAGGELERMIVTVACNRLGVNSNIHDHIREDARRLLTLIGGDGIAILLKRELESEHYWVRHGGINWSFLRKDDAVIQRLSAIAFLQVSRDATGKPESDSYSQFHQAVCALAALDAHSVIADIVLSNGVTELPMDLADLRGHRGVIPKILRKNAAETLVREESTEGEVQIALAIAWISNDKRAIPAVRAALRRSDPVSKVAGYACVVLLELGDRSDEFAQLAYRLAQTKENVRWGLNGLANLGVRGSLLLMEWLQNPSMALHREHEDFVIRMLYRHSETRGAAVAAAVASCRRGRTFFGIPYDIAAEANDWMLRDQILDKSFTGRSLMVNEPLRAIEGLAKFDAARAVDAIELALQVSPKIELQLCRLLVRLAPDVAACKLISAAVSSEQDSLRSAAGRALRRLDPAATSILITDFMNGTVLERKASAQLAAWLPVPVLADALGRLADCDSDGEVRQAALRALEHHRQEARLRALIDAFRTASYERRWAFLIILLDNADPYLLTDREDSLWLGNALSEDVPAVFAWHSNRVLKQRKQKDR